MIRLVENTLQQNPENSSEWSKLLTLLYEQRDADSKLLEIIDSTVGLGRNLGNLIERGLVIGVTFFTLAPFVYSTICVLDKRLQRAITVTKIGLIVLLLAFIIFTVYYGFRAYELRGQSSTLQSIAEDTQRQFDKINKEIGNIFSNLKAESN